NYVRKHEANGLTVSDSKSRRERVRECMGGAEHRIFDRQAGKTGAELHAGPRSLVQRVGKHAREARREPSPGLAAKYGREHVATLCYKRLHSMRESVDASQRRNARWLREC